MKEKIKTENKLSRHTAIKDVLSAQRLLKRIREEFINRKPLHRTVPVYSIYV